MSTLPANLDLSVYAGDGFSQEMAFASEDSTPIDLTGAEVTAQWRRSTTSDTAVDFTVTVTDAEAGEITIELSGEQTSTLQSGVWDLEMVIPGFEPRTLVGGLVSVYSQVTR